MSNQTSLFEQAQSDGIREQVNTICENLNQILLNNYLDESFLHVKRASGYWSVLFENSAVVRIHEKPLKISLRKSVLKQNPSYQQFLDDGKDLYAKIPLKNASEIMNHMNLISVALQAAIDSYPKEWDCCHRYVECSDMKRCTHPDMHEGIKCGYRKNLADGKIFYGRNCTV